MFRLIAVAVAAAFGLAAVSAQAQSTVGTTDGLAALCNSFLAGSAGGVPGDHDKLCSCLVRETPSQLSADEMSAFAQAALANKAAPDEVTKKMVTIASRCLLEAQ